MTVILSTPDADSVLAMLPVQCLLSYLLPVETTEAEPVSEQDIHRYAVWRLSALVHVHLWLISFQCGCIKPAAHSALDPATVSEGLACGC